ncbi:carboxypeptidase regulatory-like domain-containing protein [Pandoraea pnomenusa]|uniref:hypothetical protein n=1 Tax=Pandoraea pnomenusa TaxID=93220 RepID=UPI00042253D7|nr:hypothetical protein [Pandoraea pnomenusa]
MFREARHMTRLLALALLACCLTSLAARAAPGQPVQAGDEVSYITGGIGEDEVREFREVAPKYNLRMTFASKTGSYLSDVDVTITTLAGHQMLAVRTEGPFLFVRIPAGGYRIVAQTARNSEVRKVQVPTRGNLDLHFAWDDPDYFGNMYLCKGCPKPRR